MEMALWFIGFNTFWIGSALWFHAYWYARHLDEIQGIRSYLNAISGWVCREMAERDKITQEMKHATSARELPKQERPTIEKFGEWADGPNGDPEKQEKPAERRDEYSGAYLKREFGED